MNNVFIAIDGINGSGKTTIAKCLEQNFGFQYYDPSTCFTDLRKDFFKKPVNIPGRFSFFLLTLIQASNDIRSMLEKGPVVCDGYTASLLAHHLPFAEGLDEVASGSSVYDKWNILKPSFNILLQTDILSCSNRLRREISQRRWKGANRLDYVISTPAGPVVDVGYFNQVFFRMVSLIAPLELSLLDINNQSVEQVATTINNLVSNKG